MELANRDEIERRLARVISKDLRGELEKLLAYLGDPPDLNNIPHDYWQNGWRSIQKDVEPVLLDVYLQQAKNLMMEIGVGVGWDLINRDASNWARTHTESLLKELFGKRYDHLNTTIPRFYEEGWNLGQLRSDLERWYSPVRAEMIAVTETTRAAVEGERALAAQLEKESGIKLIPVWQTSKDERVCLLCGPKHGKEIVDGKYPPEHPNCRCWVVYRLPKV